MEVNLHIEKLETEKRWNRLEWFERELRPCKGRVLGRFLSYRDDDTFVWLHGFRDREERLAAEEIPQTFVRESIVRTLTPSVESNYYDLDDFARLDQPIIEVRQYGLAPGTRERFATFLRERVLDYHAQMGMVMHGPFNILGEDDMLAWFRGFPSLVERDRRKAAWYQSAYWLNELEEEAFSMIRDYSNVILVTPVM